jgi:hypothetical protein
MPMTTQTTSVAAEEKTRQMPQLNGAITIGAGGDRPRRMVRLTVNLPSELVEQMRDAVYWTPGLTLAWMIAQAVRASLADLKTAHQGPFPRRPKPLRAGRPRLLGQSMSIQSPSLNQTGGTVSNGMVRPRIPSNGHLK